jgi:hypothetical protein
MDFVRSLFNGAEKRRISGGFAEKVQSETSGAEALDHNNG